MPDSLHPSLTHVAQFAKAHWDADVLPEGDGAAYIEYAPRFSDLPDALIPPGYRLAASMNLCTEFSLDIHWLFVGSDDALYLKQSGGDYCDDDYDASLSAAVTSAERGRSLMLDHALSLATPLLNAIVSVDPSRGGTTFGAAVVDVPAQIAGELMADLCAQRNALQERIRHAAKRQLEEVFPWPVTRIEYSITSEYDDHGDNYRYWSFDSVEVVANGRQVRIHQCCGDYDCDARALPALFPDATGLDEGLDRLQACMPDDCAITELLSELGDEYGSHSLSFELPASEVAA